jgi:hypothetical protein
LERPQDDARYLDRFSVFFTAARMVLSTSFWSELRASGIGSRSFPFSAKNSSSADLRLFFEPAVK